LDLEVSWVGTARIGSCRELAAKGFDSLFIAPGSPYENLDGALAAITLGRTQNIPLLGTCGGFQHVALEFARNVLGIADAHHAEYDPYASDLFITPLSCSLAGQEMTVGLRPGSRAATAYGCSKATERYFCNFGLNPDYREALVAAGLVVSGVDEDDEARVIELPGHRFFLATLFVPHVSSTPASPHPLLSAFVGAAAQEP
jgi:CTP synthase (UTP-ammonia lyase)